MLTAMLLIFVTKSNSLMFMYFLNLINKPFEISFQSQLSVYMCCLIKKRRLSFHRSNMHPFYKNKYNVKATWKQIKCLKEEKVKVSFALSLKELKSFFAIQDQTLPLMLCLAMISLYIDIQFHVVQIFLFHMIRQSMQLKLCINLCSLSISKVVFIAWMCWLAHLPMCITYHLDQKYF